MRNPKCLKRGKYGMADFDKDVLAIKSNSNGKMCEIAPPCRRKAQKEGSLEWDLNWEK